MAHSDNLNRDLERFLENNCGCAENDRSAPASIACDEAALILAQPDAGAAVKPPVPATSV